MKVNSLIFSIIIFLSASALAVITPLEDHPIKAGEYVVFLKVAALTQDPHVLYHVEMASQIERDFECEGYFFQYMLFTQEDDDMLGLTELDAMRYCNWVE